MTVESLIIHRYGKAGTFLCAALALAALVFIPSISFAQCTAIAGVDRVFSGAAITLGGSPTVSGGTPPYTYQWLPNTGFTGGTNNTQANPQVAPNQSISYTVTVTDRFGRRCTASVMILNINTTITYIQPQKTLDGGYQVKQNNKIYFSYEEEYVSGSLSYQIIDPTTNLVVSCTVGGTIGSGKALGDNRYFIDVPTCSPGLIVGRFYVVEITNDKSEKTYFRFLN